MKAFRKLCITITAVFVLLAAVLNVCLLRTDSSSGWTIVNKVDRRREKNQKSSSN